MSSVLISVVVSSKESVCKRTGVYQCSIVIVRLGTRPIACRDSAGPVTCFRDSMPAWQLVVVRLVS